VGGILVSAAKTTMWSVPLLLTGNVPSDRMCDSAFSMSAMLMDSAQSQSRRPSLTGSLRTKGVTFLFFDGAPAGLEKPDRLAHSLVFGPVKVVLVQYEAVWEDVSEEPGEGGLAARRAAGHTHDNCLLATHAQAKFQKSKRYVTVGLICRGDNIEEQLKQMGRVEIARPRKTGLGGAEPGSGGAQTCRTRPTLSGSLLS
jgi:hypothetical protein